MTASNNASLLILLLALIPHASLVDAESIQQCPANPKTATGACAAKPKDSKKKALPECSISEDTDFPGADLNVAEDVESAQECSKICFDTRGCKGWTYGKADLNCYLKSAPFSPAKGKKSSCCFSGTPCSLTPEKPKDPLQSPEVQRRLKLQAEVILKNFNWLFEEQKSFFMLLLLVGAVVFFGIQMVGSAWFSANLARVKPSPKPHLADGAEKKAVLTTDDGMVLATRGAALTLPFSYAAVLGNTQWLAVSQLKYSYKTSDGELCEVCADVVEREREVVSPSMPTLLTLTTFSGAIVRIDGEKAELVDPDALGKKTAVPIEAGGIICPLVHLEDRTRLQKASEEYYARLRQTAATQL